MPQWLSGRHDARSTHLFLGNDQVTELALPTRQRIRELLVILTRSFAIGGALANLQLQQKLTHLLPAKREDLLTIDLFLKQEYCISLRIP